MTEKEIEEIRKKYVKGTKIKLIKMYDKQAVPTGEIGTVEFVDDIGTIHMKWKNGSSLGLIVGVDNFEILDKKFNIKNNSNILL